MDNEIAEYRKTNQQIDCFNFILYMRLKEKGKRISKMADSTSYYIYEVEGKERKENKQNA